jgi:hypothetical protein
MLDFKPIPEYQNEAVRKYIQEKRDTIQVYLPKGYRKVVKKHAKQFQLQEGERGKTGYIPAGSVSAFVCRAIEETIKRDMETEEAELRAVAQEPNPSHERVMEELSKIQQSENKGRSRKR